MDINNSMNNGLRFGKVIAYHPDNTVDVWLPTTGGIIYNAEICEWTAGTAAAMTHFPTLNTISGNTQKNVGVISPSGSSDPVTYKPVPNLYWYENIDPSRYDLEDPLSSYVYAVVGYVERVIGKTQPICLGFIIPKRNQVLFNPLKPPQNATSSAKEMLPAMAGAFLHRTNSAVYTTTDANGNMEWCHPNGSFFRIAEAPDDNIYHVDLTGANAMAEGLDSNGNPDGTQLTTRWDTSKQTGVDGNPNSQRKTYAHFEIVTEAGTVLMDVNRSTGNITIQTPKSAGSVSSSNDNSVIIVASGDAIIKSVNGNVTVQAVGGNVNVEAESSVSVETNTASSNSITLSPNSGQLDNLVFLHNLMKKFNSHTHICQGTGKPTQISNQQLDESDGTNVTQAG